MERETERMLLNGSRCTPNALSLLMIRGLHGFTIHCYRTVHHAKPLHLATVLFPRGLRGLVMLLNSDEASAFVHSTFTLSSCPVLLRKSSATQLTRHSLLSINAPQPPPAPTNSPPTSRTSTRQPRKAPRNARRASSRHYILRD